MLRSLEEQDLVATVPDGQLRYTAMPPDIAVSSLVERRRQAQRSLERDSEGLLAELTETWLRGRRHAAPLRYVEVLRDPDAIAARMSKVLGEVRHEYLVLVRPPFHALPEPDDDLENIERVRAIYERSVLELPAVGDFVRRAVAAGEQARLADSLPLKLVIADRRHVAVHLPDPVADETQYTMLLVEHPDLAEVMALAFESLWAAAEPFDADGGRPTDDAG